MGAGESAGKNVNGSFPEKKREPGRRYTRDEIIKMLTVVTDEEKIKSDLLVLLSGPKKTAGTEFSWTSIYDPDDPDRESCTAKALGEKPFDDPYEDRSFGAMLGMAVGDALGAPQEFSPLDYEANDVKGMGTDRAGRFNLLPGQWTDDTSMGLCVADSLLVKGRYDGHDMMHRFLAWWFCGMNNSGRFEEDEINHTSVGLGSQMKKALYEYVSDQILPTQCGDKKSSGNGSLMRLAAVPIFFRKDIETAEKVAEQQSLITHQGTESAECCRLMAHIMVRGICGEDLHTVLESLETSFKTDCPGVRALANSKAEKLKPKEVADGKANKEKQSSTEGGEGDDKTDKGASEVEEDDPDRNWNWKADDFKYSPLRVKYSSGYIGGYAMDGLAMALHILWKTSSFSEAVLKAANLRGDADTVAAIVGQIGGSYYGCSSIPNEWKKTVMKWDNHEIALRAHKLCLHELLELPQPGDAPQPVVEKQ